LKIILKIKTMKKYNIILAVLLVGLIIITGSCKKWIDPDINTDPNKPTDVTVNAILPAAQAGMGYTAGGDLKYAASIWMQQMAGGANQPLAYDRYVYTQSDVDNVWKWNLYAGPMMDCYRMIQKAENEGDPYYSGIAKVMMAYQLGSVTDLWGDVPYSEAFQGDANLKPAYDTQEEIYTSLKTLLDEAITSFNTSASANFRIPGSDDFIYGGEMGLWKKTAYALKARYALHLSKRNGASAYTEALTDLTNAFASNSEDFEFVFGNAYNESNPLFQFNDQRTYDIVTGAYLVDSLVATNDPRLPLLVDGTDGYVGSHAGQGDGWALIGSYYASPNSPVPFISYVECKFIEAECKFQTGDVAGAATAYNTGVLASLAKFGVTDSTFEATYANDSAASITLEKIMQQKYYALCFQLEVYNDWRRTGLPVLQPASPAALSEIPRRYPYPTSEIIYNSANVPSVTLTTRVWWDQ
jgi:hypothetical protein